MNTERAPLSPFYRWSAKIRRDTLPELQSLASNLGFIVNTPGRHDGEPATPKLLDALAAAYRADSGAVIDALREIGVVNPAEPAAD